VRVNSGILGVRDQISEPVRGFPTPPGRNLYLWQPPKAEVKIIDNGLFGGCDPRPFFVHPIRRT